MSENASWKIGDVTVTMVIERHTELPVGDFIPVAGEAVSGHREWLQPWALSETGCLRFVIQALCVEHAGEKIVVDTCIGPRQLPEMYVGLENDGSFIGALTAAGFGRDDVSRVICTHLHFDHVGWNTLLEDGHWVPTFRQARYTVVEQEYRHWMSTSEEVKARSNVLNFDDAVLPLFAAGVVDLVDSNHQINDAIELLPTPGHTPGHVSVLISSKGASALITGDCAHHPVQLARPDWYTLADADPEMSCATRQRLIDEYADSPVLIIGTHFPPPSAGRLVRGDKGVRFEPAGP
jgi:glyoxylase-like metal-dependent hydrolase (beta-lactamase superfamily II)